MGEKEKVNGDSMDALDEYSILGKQVSEWMDEEAADHGESMDKPETEVNTDIFVSNDSELEEINDSLAEQISMAITEQEVPAGHTVVKKRKRTFVTCCVLGILLLVAGALLLTKAGQKMVIQTVVAPNLYDEMFDYDSDGRNDSQGQGQAGNGEDSNGNKPAIISKDGIVNILLIGVEEIQNARNTDVLIVASMNCNTNELSVVSLMRDLYVEIPGHSNNKLNAAYALGGIDLLYQTIETNFGIRMDGYILVNFGTFETIVDLLGGVDVTLTQEEATYLNRTNYISNANNRTVVAGTQRMNGNQALGYCRVRHVSTGKERDDFGRTARQRVVLNAMFNQLKSKNLFQLVSFMNRVFASVQVKTDISKSRFSEYLGEVVDFKLSELEQYRIPADRTFYGDNVYIGKRKQSVLIPNDWNETRSILHQYIFKENDTSSSDE